MPTDAPPPALAPSQTASPARPFLRSGWFAAAWLGILVSLSLPNVDLWPLAFVAWIPLFAWLAHEPRGKRRFLVGWLGGGLYQLLIFRWIPFTITQMTPLPEAVAWLMALAYAAWHGLPIACFAALSRPLQAEARRLHRGLGAVALPLLLVPFEWLWPVVFAWSPAHALWEVAPLHHVVATFGVPGLLFALLLPQAALAEAWRPSEPDEGPASHRAPHPVHAAHAGGKPGGGPWLPLALAALFFGVGLLTWRLAATAPVIDTLRVAVLQPNWTLAEKKHATRQVRERLLERFAAQLAALPRDHFDLVIASEGAFPLYWRLDTPAPGLPLTDPAQAATRRIQTLIAEHAHTHAMIGGLREVLPASDSQSGASSGSAPGPNRRRELANSVVFFAPDGAIAGHYDKRLLVPFSEAVPFSDVFPALRDAVPGFGTLHRGEADCLFPLAPAAHPEDVDETRERRPIVASCGVCYENLFARETRAGIGEARVLANFTIDTWFGDATAPGLHLASHASRALELGVPFLRSALTGISAVIAPDGEVLGRLPLDVEARLNLTLPLRDWTPPYRHVGELFAMVATALAIVLGALALARRRRPQAPSAPGEAA